MAARSDPTLTSEDVITLDRAAVVARLLAGVVHDVNNALLVISGTAEMLEPGGGAGVADGLARIRTRSARAAASIAEVLAFARGEPGERRNVNLREIASRAVDLRTFSIKRARLNVTIDAPEDGVFVVTGSPVLLLQAVLGLIANAEQALAGRQDGAIRVAVDSGDGIIRVRVSDNGPGVAPQDRERIFEPLFTTRPRDHSSGLGLAAARAIADAHGGSLTLEETSTGASFVLSVPRAPA